jgi:hypothetical protein
MSTVTSFNTEKLDAEAVETANKRLQEMGLNNPPATPPQTLHAPHGASVDPRPAAPEPEKKTRITVGKLQQKFEAKLEEAKANITKIEGIINTYQSKLKEEQFKAAQWSEVLAEMNAD